MSMSKTASVWKRVSGLRPVLAGAALTMMVVAITTSAQAQLRSLKAEVTPSVPEAQTFGPGGKRIGHVAGEAARHGPRPE
jgi:hypothetical protein